MSTDPTVYLCKDCAHYEAVDGDERGILVEPHHYCWRLGRTRPPKVDLVTGWETDQLVQPLDCGDQRRQESRASAQNVVPKHCGPEGYYHSARPRPRPRADKPKLSSGPLEPTLDTPPMGHLRMPKGLRDNK